MDRTLFISFLNFQCGIGEAAREFLKLWPTPVRAKGITDYRIKKYDFDLNPYQQFTEYPTHTFQLFFPDTFYPLKDCKNIGYVFLETYREASTGRNNWHIKMREMDEMWVSTKREKRYLDSLDIKTRIVPQPFNFEEINPDPIPKYKNYTFYHISDAASRKNIDTLLKAWVLFADEKSPFDLVLKIPVKQETINEQCKKLCEKFKKRSFKIPIVVNQFLSREKLLELHKKCHAYIITSSEECFSRPLIEAAYIGNTTIATANTSMTEEINVSVEIPSYKEYCYGSEHREIYTFKEYWHMPTIMGTVEAMRMAPYAEAQVTNFSRFDKKNIQKQIKCILSET